MQEWEEKKKPITIKYNIMRHIPNAFESQIFHDFREKVKEVHKSIRLLAEQGYTIIDLEGQVITKFNINEDRPYPNINYKRTPKQLEHIESDK
jgi:hypothetical protein